jgi:hypothetical protein
MYRALINFASSSLESVWKGYVYAVGLFVMSILQSLSHNLCFFHTTCLASRLSGALTAAVYRKVSGAAMTSYGSLGPVVLIRENSSSYSKGKTILSSYMH